MQTNTGYLSHYWGWWAPPSISLTVPLATDHSDASHSEGPARRSESHNPLVTVQLSLFSVVDQVCEEWYG